MRFDFLQDRRLMQDASGGGSASDMSRQIQALEAAKAGITDPAKQQVIQEAIQSLRVKLEAAGKAAGAVSTTGVQAAAGAQSKSADASIENAQNTVRTGQAAQAKSIETLLGLLQQSGTGLMQSKQSIEQMKAGFSGMIEIVGIVAKHLGADEFADSCLDLAQKLSPQKVNLDPETKKQVEDFLNAIPAKLRPEAWESHIASGQDAAGRAVTKGQEIVVDQANRGVRSAGEIEQPTAYNVTNGSSGGSNSPRLSASMRKEVSDLITSGTVTGPQGAKVGELLLKSDTNHDGKLSGSEQRAFGNGAVTMLGAAKAAVVNRELGVTGQPNARPVTIAEGPAPAAPAPS